MLVYSVLEDSVLTDFLARVAILEWYGHMANSNECV